MTKAIIGKKVGMTQLFDPDGKIIPVTVIEAGPCTVIQKKELENDGYTSVQIGFSELREKLANKPQKGHFAKAGVQPQRVLKEFRLDNIENYNVGDVLKADVFAEGDKIDVTGTSKGKGFQGTIKRWGQSRGPMTHGSGPTHRHAGSMGAGSDPSRIMKGKKLPGQMGAEQVTIQNLDVIKVDAEKNLLVIKGAIPGPKGGIVGIEPNKAVLHQYVVNYLANQRQGTQSTLTRAEVRGGGIKPWRQKGTGRARQGSIRSPQWTHGGIALGPKPRSYNYSINRKVKRLALKSALSNKVLENGFTVIDELSFATCKTKNTVELLKAFGADKKALIILPEKDDNIIRSANNIPGVKTTLIGTLNPYDLLLCDKVFVTKAGVAAIEEVYA